MNPVVVMLSEGGFSGPINAGERDLLCARSWVAPVAEVGQLQLQVGKMLAKSQLKAADSRGLDCPPKTGHYALRQIDTNAGYIVSLI